MIREERVRKAKTEIMRWGHGGIWTNRLLSVGNQLGLIPCEDSSAEHWRLGHISKQGNALLRYLLLQSAICAARCENDFRRQYTHLAMRRNQPIAKIAMARKLAVRLFWMWRRGWDYEQLKKFGSHAG